MYVIVALPLVTVFESISVPVLVIKNKIFINNKSKEDNIKEIAIQLYSYSAL